MKKIIALLVATLCIGATLVACSNDEASETTEATTVATSEETTEATSEETTEATVGLEPPTDDPNVGLEPPAEGEGEFVETVETEAGYVPPVFESENPLGEYVQAGLNVGMWGGMMGEATDTQTISDIFKIDVTPYVNYIVVSNQMSFPLQEIIILETAEGEAEAAKEVLQARVDNEVQNGMHYPDSVLVLQNSVIAVEGNYVIYVASTAPQAAVDAIVEAIKG